MPGVRTLESWPTSVAYGASDGSVLGLPAAGRALHLLTGLVCQLPIGDVNNDDQPWPSRPVLDQPWPMLGTAEWLTYQVQALLMRGDAMAIPADYDAEGYPRQLLPLHPDSVWTDIDPDTGRVRHRVLLADGVEEYGATDLWHARGLTLRGDGLRGIGVVAQYRQALTGIVEQQGYASNVWTGSGVPSGVLTVDLPEIPAAKAAQVKSDWHTSMSNHDVAVLSKMFSFQPIAWTPQDAQFLESRKFSVGEIAFMFNLDPSDLDATMGSSMTYANREQRAYERLLTSLGPILVRFQQAFRFHVPNGHNVRFDVSRLLWADSLTRAQVQEIQLRTGAATLNEIRHDERRPRFGPWADEPNRGGGPIA